MWSFGFSVYGFEARGDWGVEIRSGLEDVARRPMGLGFRFQAFGFSGKGVECERMLQLTRGMCQNQEVEVSDPGDAGKPMRMASFVSLFCKQSGLSCVHYS